LIEIKNNHTESLDQFQDEFAERPREEARPASRL